MLNGVYFCGSIRGGNEDIDIYKNIAHKLKRRGPILTPFVYIEEYKDNDVHSDKDIYNRDMKLLQQCDVVVAEVSTPSLGVGFEVAMAVNLGKKILCLHRKREGKELSALIRGLPEDKAVVVDYETVEDLDDVFKSFFEDDRQL